MLRAVDLARKSRSEPGQGLPKSRCGYRPRWQGAGGGVRGELSPAEHAEFTLLDIKLAGKTLAGATLFTTLEPCTSRDHPKIACAERIIERRIKRVYIGMLDPNEQIRGRGELRLRAAGIELARFDPDLVLEIEELNRDFTKKHADGLTRRRMKVQTNDPVKPGEVGPDGHSR